jgi:hypothetical protein
LGQDRIADLLLPRNLDELRDILLYHVLPKKSTTADFLAGPLTTLSSIANEITVSLDPLEFNGVGLATPEASISACNGVVHAIQAVLDPRSRPTPAPTDAPLVEVVVNRFYISYRTTATAVPTDQQYDANVLATKEYYEILFAEQFPNFRGLEFELDFRLSGDGTWQREVGWRYSSHHNCFCCCFNEYSCCAARGPVQSLYGVSKSRVFL